MKKYKVYMAGPFFNDEQIKWEKTLFDGLSKLNVEILRPFSSEVNAEEGKSLTIEQADAIFKFDHDMLEEADFVIGVLDDFDSGTIWELGYMYALKKPVFVVYQAAGDIKSVSNAISFDGEKAFANLMITQSWTGFFKNFDFLNEVNDETDLLEQLTKLSQKDFDGSLN